MAKKRGLFDDLIEEYAKPPDPTEGMSGFERFAAGAGKALTDIGLGTKQLLGLASKNEVEEKRRLDAALMNTGMGVAGNVVGSIGAMAPLAILPGAATVPGAALYGAAMGATEPRGEGDTLGGNMARSALLSAFVPAAVAGYRGAKSLVEPFYQGGRDKIAARTLERFGGPDVQQKVSNAAGELIQGSKPTLAEATQDAGLATLQRSAVASDPRLAAALAEREMQNNAARVQALKSLGGDAGQLEFATAARSASAQELYEKAFSEVADNSAWIKGQLSQLMKRPAFVSALKEGQELAANEGLKLGKNGSFRQEDATRILHYTKMALDDQIGRAEGNAQRALMGTRDKLVSLMESKDFSPSYREARDTFRQMSRPVNQMKTGQELANRARVGDNELLDAMGNPTLTPARFSQALRSGEDVAKSATGRKQPLSSVFDQQQMQLLENLQADLSRLNVSRTAGKPMGSPTAQYLSSQNLLQQIAGPLGLPASWAESTLLRSAVRPMDFAMKRAEPDVQEALAKALLDPEESKRLMALLMAQQSGLLGKMSKGGPYISGPLSGYLATTDTPK